MTEDVKNPAAGLIHDSQVGDDLNGDEQDADEGVTKPALVEHPASPRVSLIVSRIISSLFSAVAKHNAMKTAFSSQEIDTRLDLRNFKTEITDLGYQIIHLEKEYPDSGHLGCIIDIAIAQSEVLVSEAPDKIGKAPFSEVLASYPERLRNIAETLDVLKRRQPAVPIEESVTPDYIVCLEDGRKLKLLKRHLNRSFGMTPAQYRARWGLPDDYPMVAENYSKVRSSLAVENRLGRKEADESE